MNEIKTAKVLIYTDGTRRCSECKQRVYEGQITCPLCKAAFIQGQQVHHNDTDGTIFKAPETEWDVKRHKRRKTGLGTLISVFIVSFMMALFINEIGKGEGSTISNIVENISRRTLNERNITKHTEAPAGNVNKDASKGYNFEISQWFFQAEENDSTELHIKLFLEENKISYDNLYYTKEGYYSADLHGYTNMTYEENTKKAYELEKLFSDWCVRKGNSYGVKSDVVQSWYYSLER